MTKAPQETDRHVGSRIRFRRMQMGMSQEKLADGLGLTFQQVQKYEKGKNRIGSSRLQQIAGILGVPVEYFFAGQNSGPAPTSPSAAAAAPVDLLTGDAMKLVLAYQAIPDAALRRCVLELVRAMAPAVATAPIATSSDVVDMAAVRLAAA